MIINELRTNLFLDVKPFVFNLKMDYLKASIFDKYLSIQSEILTDDEYELKVFSYLENLKFYKDYIKLKEFSLKLHELKSNLF